jgi:DNA-binding winged helix-turn-helix (wHTH) protein
LLEFDAAGRGDRRHAGTMVRDKRVTFGPFRLDAGTESIWRAGQEIRLRPKTFAVLRYLAERPGLLITKDELLEAVWSDVAVGDAALTVCVGEIRKALGDEARTPRWGSSPERSPGLRGSSHAGVSSWG